MSNGMLMVLSGPSGCGKDTLLNRLAVANPKVRLSISATTRKQRNGEIDGVHYHFLTTEQFMELIEDEGVLEYAQYGNHWYGTPKAPVDGWLEDGKIVVLIIEVQGAAKIKEMYPDAISIFLMPPSFSELERRLRDRATDSEESIRQRLDTAWKEMACAVNYDYVVTNRVIEDAISDISSIIRAESLAVSRNKEMIEGVMKHV